MLLWAIIIGVLSLMPADRLPDMQLNLLATDKLAHMGVYFILNALWIWGCAKQGWLNTKTIFWGVIGSVAWGIVMEWAQYAFFSSRHFEVYDIIANIIGVLISLLVLFIFK